MSLLSQVYETIEHALYHQTHLFYNRHIDQIMLSALYGYCKVHKLQQVRATLRSVYLALTYVCTSCQDGLHAAAGSNAFWVSLLSLRVHGVTTYFCLRRLQVSFREIIAQYRKQPQSQQPIFRSVVIEQSNPGLQVRPDVHDLYCVGAFC